MNEELKVGQGILAQIENSGNSANYNMYAGKLTYETIENVLKDFTSPFAEGESEPRRIPPTSNIERMVEMQNELNDLHYRNQVNLYKEYYKDTKLVPEKEETIDEDFLCNLEKNK